MALFFKYWIFLMLTVLTTSKDHERNKYSMDQDPKSSRRRFILYDVNRGEGFNLRRDVYVRVSVFVKKLQQSIDCQDEWILVLPPWGPLYHWQSKQLKKQIGLPWSRFFEVQSLSRFTKVMEFSEFLRQRNTTKEGVGFVDRLLYLQHFPFDGNWEDRVKEEPCKSENEYEQDDEGHWRGVFWGYRDQFYARQFSCLSVMGRASILAPYLESKNDTAVMLERAETLLHDSYGDVLYWTARRSMVFASELRLIGDRFRADFLDSRDEADATVMLEDWEKNAKKPGDAKGGPYLGIHLRRKDYLFAKEKEVPSITSAALQSEKILRLLNLSKVFVATDAPDEFNSFSDDLRKLNPDLEAYRFDASPETLEKIGDGGVAIVDQWIASHARHFIGTHESTFSFRIQEERQILGFHPDSIFNRFCGSNPECERPSRWLIQY